MLEARKKGKHKDLSESDKGQNSAVVRLIDEGVKAAQSCLKS